MKYIIKSFLILIASAVGLILLLICLLFISIMIDEHEESKFSNIKIPSNLSIEKPIEYLSTRDIQELKNSHVTTNKIVVTGSGYVGYDFYVWYCPQEPGNIYLKAFEITQNKRLTEERLKSRTTFNVASKEIVHKLYTSESLIYEGHLEAYYPARFELWFQPKNGLQEIKICEQNYLINGWDR